MIFKKLSISKLQNGTQTDVLDLGLSPLLHSYEKKNIPVLADNKEYC